MYAGCPITWLSKLQTEIALSTTEAECIALSQAMREVIPFMNLMQEIDDIFGLHNPSPKIHCKVFEDNRSCIKVAESPKFTPRTKHIAIKYHCQVSSPRVIGLIHWPLQSRRSIQQF